MAHHDFEPTTYHNTFGWHEPELTVQPGDSVRTSTVDARGGDRYGKTVAVRGNPQSGPFAVAGAEPGDTLVVTLDRVRITRAWGFSSSALAANVIEFEDEPRFADDADRSFWDIDVEAGTIRLQVPERAPAGEPVPARNRLHDVTLPLRPMIGCVAVAPPGRQHISTATSGPFGGNMDYNRVVEGLRLYFPVFAPGALFHLGDGHALQGDGEMDGTGVEVPMDVTLTLDLVKGQAIEWPRFQNDSYIMTAGNLRPLDQAVQHATSEMVRWLEADYGLTTREAHMLLARMVEYDLGNMFDPAYTMICKLRKDVLREVAGR